MQIHRIKITTVLFLLIGFTMIPGETKATEVPLENAQWNTGNGASVQNSLVRIEGGATAGNIGHIAWLKDVVFEDGTIEFELKSVKRNDRGHNYLGVIFRVADDLRYDLVYLRFRNDEAAAGREIQYIPVKDGKDEWQKYRRQFNAARNDLRDGEWIKMRLVVEGTTLKVFFGDEQKPSLVEDHILSPSKGGSVGFWAYPTSGSGEFRNLKIVLKESLNP